MTEPNTQQSKMAILIYGQNGTGKTQLASTASELGKTAYIYLKGEPDWKSVPAKYRKNMEQFQVDNIEKLDDLYAVFETGDHNFDCVVIETVTAVQQNFIRYYLRDSPTKIRAKDAVSAKTPSQPEWGRINTYLQDHVWFWYGLTSPEVTPRPVHVIMTCQAAFKEDALDQERIEPDVSPQSRRNVTGTPDHILYTFVDEDLTDPNTAVHKVRLRPTPLIGAKVHVDDESLLNEVPAVWDDQSDRLTLQLLAELTDNI